MMTSNSDGCLKWPAFASLALLREISQQNYTLEWESIAEALRNDVNLLNEARIKQNEASSVFSSRSCKMNFDDLVSNIPFPKFYYNDIDDLRQRTAYYGVILNAQRIEELENVVKQSQQQFKSLTSSLERTRNEDLDERQLNIVLEQIKKERPVIVTIPKCPEDFAQQSSEDDETSYAKQLIIDQKPELTEVSSNDNPNPVSEAKTVDDEEKPASILQKTLKNVPDSLESLISTADSTVSSETASSASNVLSASDSQASLKNPLQSHANQSAKKAFRNNILHLWQNIVNHKHGALFVNPVKKDEAPDYYRVVKCPMDLNYVKTRVREGLCNDTLEFERDIYQTFVNAIMFNPEDALIHIMAKEIMSMTEQEIGKYKSTEKLVAYRRNSLQSNN